MRRIAVPVFVLALLPGPLRAADVVLEGGDLVRTAPFLWQAPGLSLPPQDTALPLVGDSAVADGVRLLRHLSGRGGLNGFEGILYDNRDRGHSRLAPALFPRLAHLAYGPDLVAADMDYGLAGAILMPAVVFGNSSTAVTGGAVARSLTRLAMTSPRGPDATARLYENDHLYIYPEHNDHDAEDLFPANWPYTITSQGSSGSDQPFLGAVAMTLAAFPADTFKALHDRGLVAPTVQMILRRTLAGIDTRDAYLSGLAHPPVFDGARLRAGRMVAMAAAMRPGDIPPVVRLRVLDEDFRPSAGLAGQDERLFDTPSAVARVWRGFEAERSMTLSVAETADPNGRPLRFEWRLLKGDPARVRIEPIGPDGAAARLTIAWHDPFAEPAPGGEGYVRRSASRVDIGVFAHNGVHDSAPALISVAFPAHERRVFTPSGANGALRLFSIDYDAAARGAYYDPLLHWSAPWSDTARHAADGTLSGWYRTWPGGRRLFVPAGAVAAGAQPLYRIDRADPGRPVLQYLGK